MSYVLNLGKCKFLHQQRVTKTVIDFQCTVDIAIQFGLIFSPHVVTESGKQTMEFKTPSELIHILPCGQWSITVINASQVLWGLFLQALFYFNSVANVYFFTTAFWKSPFFSTTSWLHPSWICYMIILSCFWYQVNKVNIRNERSAWSGKFHPF